MDIWKKSVKKFPTFIFKGALKPVFIRCFPNVNLVVIGRHGYLDKNAQKIPWFYFSRYVKVSIYKDFFRHQSCCNRETYGWKDKSGKNQPKIFPF